VLRESLGIHRFSEKEARFLLKSAEASLALAEGRGLWHRCRHFSFVFRGGRLLSVGLNSSKSHPRNLLYAYMGRDGSDISHIIGTHSEMNAVLRTDSDECRGATMVNLRINRRGDFDYSRPCSGCCDMLRSLGFVEAFYTHSDGRFVSMEIGSA
jgi:hypothetical protein